MLALIICLVAPLFVGPIVIFASRWLFARFLTEGASLFVGLELHSKWARSVGTSVAVLNVVIFTLGWWAAVAFSASGMPAYLPYLPLLAAVPIAWLATAMFLRLRLALQPKHAAIVSLLSFAGGNLPLILIMPLMLTNLPQAIT